MSGVEPPVSTATPPAAPTGQSSTGAPPSATPPAVATPPPSGAAPTPPAAVEPPKTGFDAFPDAAKDIIKRNAEGKRQAEARATAAEAELNKLRSSPSTPPPALDPETQAGVEEFKRLASLAGYKSEADVQNMLSERDANFERQKIKEADDVQKTDVLKKFDGVSLPKLSMEELEAYYESLDASPSLSYLKGAPWEEIARKMKENEVRQMEVDQILRKGGQVPPIIEKGTGQSQTPSNQIKQYNNPSDLQKGLMNDLRTQLKK